MIPVAEAAVRRADFTTRELELVGRCCRALPAGDCPPQYLRVLVSLGLEASTG